MYMQPSSNPPTRKKLPLQLPCKMPPSMKCLEIYYLAQASEIQNRDKTGQFNKNL